MKNKFKIKIVSHCVGLLPLSFVVFAMLANLGVTSVYASETLTFIHQDHLSSTTLATNSSGQVVSRQVYYPYGSTRNTQGVLPTERAYTSQVSDTDTTGLYYYNARYYNPTLALFTQADTTNDTLNRYAYVGSNPLSRVDVAGSTCRGLGCPRQDPATMSEPIDVARARVELTAKYGLLVHPSINQTSPFFDYDPTLQWPEWVVDYISIEETRVFFSTQQLKAYSEALSRINSKIYTGKWLIPIPDFACSGGASGLGVEMGVLGTSDDILATTFYHEMTHLWQINYDSEFQDLIKLANQYGYTGGNDYESLWSYDRGYQIGYKALSGDVAASDNMVSNTYAYYNWGEFFAVVVGDVATNMSYARSVRSQMPDLYAYLVKTYFNGEDPCPVYRNPQPNQPQPI